MYSINFHGIKTEAVDYKGIQIIRNSLNNGWMLFFDKKGEYSKMPPMCGTLKELKILVDGFVKIGTEKYFIKEGTYKNE